jgi:energy-converting hydrogenase Eha subunit E
VIRNVVRGGLIGLLLSVAFAMSSNAAPPPDDPAGPVPLVPVPAGCPAPQAADVVFVGTMTGKDDITQTVRFRIDQLRAGSAGPWAMDGQIDIRYGEDYRFLVEGAQYLVGAGLDPAYGALSSTVRPAEPTFGGNDVIGVDDTAVVCPVIDDPIRTLNVDGTSVDSGVLSLLFDDRRLLLATIAVPTALALAALLALVVLRVFGNLAARGVFDLGRAAVTPVPDHRAVRVRRHRPDPE